MGYSKTKPSEGVPARPFLPGVERAVLEYWESDQTFRASVEARGTDADGGSEFVLLDGPPFADGLPHYGHLLAGYAKDAVSRYRTMRGDRVERRFGWTCHGLPSEMEVEKQLGISSKRDIESLGVDAFNRACRSFVMRHTQEWRDYVSRQARWVDFDNDCKTMDLTYMESVMWAFKTVWDKGLIYQGHSISWYCGSCETPLSDSESEGTMDHRDTGREQRDPELTVRLRLESGELALLWTRAPWVLPSTLAVAVHPEAEYVTVEHGGERYLLAASRLSDYARELGEDVADRVVATTLGADLADRRYTPPFDFFADHDNAHRLVTASDVSTDEGTGLVPVAPAYGETDQAVAEAAGIALVLPVDAGCRFTDEVAPYAGRPVLDASPAIVRDLEASGAVLRHATHRHRCPHCWRCGTRLLERAVPSWFLAVDGIRRRMLELNQQISWTPERVRDGLFGKWLENAHDWNISRNRYWGAPMPVWISDDPAFPRTDVYGSLEELRRDFGVQLSDLHRPAIDELTRPNPDDPTGRSTMRRIPEVLDCWFETGSMPFAHVHYPFENTGWFERHNPCDLVVEYHAQTRGWFYYMHVLATALFDRPAFDSCSVLGVVTGTDGHAMSKSRNNYLDIPAVFDRDGSDAMRWSLLSSPLVRGSDLVVTERNSQEALRQAVMPLWNAWAFHALHAGTAGREGRRHSGSTQLLDRYLLARTRLLVGETTRAMESHDLAAACALMRDFLDALTNWYIRCSRARFAGGDTDAIDTLHTVLEILCRLMAPLLPMISEHVWRGLTGERSVHLTDWPAESELPADDPLVAAVERTRQIVSTTLALRRADGLRIRLPLARLTVACDDHGVLEPLTGLIREQANVKEVVLAADPTTYGTIQLSVNARACGRRLGSRTQEVIDAVAAGAWVREPDGGIRVAGIPMRPEEIDERLVADTPGSAVLPNGAGLVVLDTRVTEELAAEGMARDLVRVAQQARRAAGLRLLDRIELNFEVPDDVAAAVRPYEAFIARETVADTVYFKAVGRDAFTGSVGNGARARASVSTVHTASGPR
ncbi:isoleucine--tRNA ligase [Streptomyces endocoffeicus]|uniref:isoleucine--tRNA ligase n=1 Tax=Streptomyces endocoffeicus TaxID=2898945 RepID=UPI0027DD5910|nr:isoleucine--tRNA ligase [Streptomyces endocoffeicus]